MATTRGALLPPGASAGDCVPSSRSADEGYCSPVSNNHNSPGRLRGGLVTFVIALGLLAVVGLGLSAGGSAALAAAVLLSVTAGLMLARASLVTVGIGAACAAAFTMPWNGWKIGPVRPGDVFILIALSCFLAADIGGELPKLPRWVSQVGFVTVLVAALHELLPTDPHYLEKRVVLDAVGRPTLEVQSNLVVAPKLVIAVVGVALTFCFAAVHDRRAPRWLAISYAAGTAVSGLIAFSDGRGLTSIGRSVTGNITEPGRQGGLSDHPNFLAGTCVLAMSLTIWLVARRAWRSQLLGAALMLAILVGTYSSGSRGGAACLVIAIVGGVLVIPRFRPYLPTIAFGMGTLAVSGFVVFPSAGQAVLRATRLTGGGVSTEGSNQVRAMVGAQGVADFHHSPIDGVGFQVSAEAQNVYLQELAAGGLLLFVSMTIYWLFAMYSARRLMPYDELAGPLLVSLLAGAALNLVGASLTDRFYYVPSAIVVALVVRYARDHAQEDSSARPPGRAAEWAARAGAR